jgi:pimeloyl-[acyl-carrier protein] methyl ester esterase
MSVYTEIFGQGRPLVMIHGWAMHGGVWRAFARQLAESRQVICVDLPGHGRSAAIAPYSLQHVAQAVLDALPVAEFDVLGWSLGATVALEMARLSPQRIRSLCMLSANPCFVRQDSWPGMPAELLAVFMAQLQTKPAQTLSRFLALQVNESAEAKAVLQQLKTVMRECLTPEPEVLQAGLRMLADSDLRPTLTRLSCPLHLILGDRDSLIPLAAGQAMLALNSGMYLHVIETAGHVPFLSHQQLLLNILLAALSA